MKNPVIGGYHADPFVYRDGGDYYMVLTSENEPGTDAVFHCYHSTDLQHWSEPKVILNVTRDITWANDLAWAPSLVKKDGLWYFVFVAEHKIGVAVCDSPMGTYRDVLGAPLIGEPLQGEYPIDPSLFADTDGTVYLLWGNGKCLLSRISLAPDSVRLEGEILCLSNDFYWQRSRRLEPRDSGLYCEAPDLTLYQGRYLLTWSCYDTRDYRYCIRYAWADRVTGPYIQPLDEDHDNILVHHRGPVQCTGHGNPVQLGGGLYLAYHRFAIPRSDYHREVCCDKIDTPDGLHLEVIPTL